MHHSVKAFVQSGFQSLLRKNSISSLLRPRDSKPGLPVQQWRSYPKSIFQNPSTSKHFMIKDLANLYATTRFSVSSFGLRHPNASILPLPSPPTIPDALGARSITIVSSSVIVILSILFPLTMTVWMFFCTLEGSTHIDIPDLLGVWLVVSDITGRDSPFLCSFPSAITEAADHPVSSP